MGFTGDNKNPNIADLTITGGMPNEEFFVILFKLTLEFYSLEEMNSKFAVTIR